MSSGEKLSTPSEDSLGDKASTPCTEDSLGENIDLVQKQSGENASIPCIETGLGESVDPMHCDGLG